MTVEQKSRENFQAFGLNDPLRGPFFDAKVWRPYGIDLPLRLTAELLTFASRRLQAQAEHVEALGRCNSPAEALKLQMAFLTRALSEYQSEVGTLSQDVADTAYPRPAAKAA
ncbi:phasin family protein [Methylobacterium nodulans]|uniref:Phasin domain-containing protein n=1 Tax=Methylobacterium nodulans (strain LMG 21967 / CNCM I-2342 / ORS 2060) TaxID=460265 RepID=B8IB97_METNO|nr:phasin family protein [Methylobacterium nodulans]ACL57312.1 conserved hypothetical protein [Methylobacterium nodulans ORS 2060]